MSQRVFVTGATGVLGRRVVPALVAAGHTVTAVVRSEPKADAVRAAGATPVWVDLFDRDAVRAAITNHDSVAVGGVPISMAHERIATTCRRAHNRGCGCRSGDRTVHPGIDHFPYVDRGDEWIDEQCERNYYWATESTVAAEAAAADVTAAGGVGIVLRFAMLMAPDSAHTRRFVAAAKRGLFALVGKAEGFTSFVHVDDAAAAVMAALDAPAGTFNVAEPDPVRRSTHRDALAGSVGHGCDPYPAWSNVPAAAPRTASPDRIASHRIASTARCDTVVTNYSLR